MARQSVRVTAPEWKNKNDQEYWTKLADYVDKEPSALTVMDQAVFMRCTMSLCSREGVFLWDSEGTKDDYVDALIDLYNVHGKKPSVLYRAVLTVTAQDQILPRVAAVDVLLLALCSIYHIQIKKPDGNVATLVSVDPAARVTPAAAGDFKAALKAALSIGGTVAWAMPPPYNVVAVSGISLVEMLFSNSDSENPLQVALNGLKDYLNLHEIAETAQYLNDYTVWLQQMQAQIRLDGDDVADSVLDGYVSHMDDVVAPDGELFVNVSRLAYLRTQNEAAFPVHVLGQSIAILTLKLLVQLRATLAGRIDDKKDPDGFSTRASAMFDAYVKLLVYTQGSKPDRTSGCIEEVAQFIEDRCDERLSRIRAPYEHSRFMVGRIGKVAGWTFKDEEPGVGDDDTTHWIEGTDRTAIDDAFRKYKKTVTKALDEKYGLARKTLRRWRDSILEWNTNIPPATPRKAPAIVEDGWGTPPPAGSVWTKFQKVRYASMNVNSSGPNHIGPSTLSPWSRYVELNGRAHPTLSLDGDERQMTSAIRIYRQFEGDKEHLVGLSTGEHMLTYRDDKN